MRVWFAAAAASFALFLVQPASAQTQADVDACNGAPPQYSDAQIIAGCTVLFRAGGADARNASIFHMNRGVAYGRLGNHAAAMTDYNQAIALDPANDTAWSNRGATRLSQGDAAGAMADLDQAIRINPANAPAYFNRGLVFRAQNNYARAVAEYDQAIRYESSNADYYGARGEARLLLGEVEMAAGDINRAIAMDPRAPRAYLARAALQAAAGQFDLALADIDRFIQLDPGEPAGPQMRAAILEEKAKALRASSAPASGAGWNDTRWGMSSPEVERLYPGGNHIFGGEDFTVFRAGQYRGISWRSISFRFVSTGEGLESVSLEVREPAAALRRKLTALFGAPRTETNGPHRTDRFRDRASGDEIVMATDTRQDWSSVTWISGKPVRAPQAVGVGLAPQWRSPLSEFKTNFPAARQLMEGSIFWGLQGPNLHGRSWKRGHFSFPGDELSEYTLFSSDGYDAIVADFTTRFGPSKTQFGQQVFTDRLAGAELAVRRNADGTATVAVRPIF